MYDIVVFGATGFTGQHVVATLHTELQKRTTLKIAIAGRSRCKLDAVLQRFGAKFDVRTLPHYSLPQPTHSHAGRNSVYWHGIDVHWIQKLFQICK